MFALPNSMPRFKSIIFYQYSHKIKFFLKKNANFQALGAPPPDPQAPPLPNCEFVATRLPHFALFIIIWVFLGFVLNNFFLIV